MEKISREQKILNNSWAVEWSPGSKWFDIGRVIEMFHHNNSIFQSGEKPDCVCLGIFKSIKDVEKCLAKAREVLKKLNITETTLEAALFPKSKKSRGWHESCENK